MVAPDGKRRRLLITGGAGFVGVNLIAHLAERGGYEITVLDDESLGDRRHLPTSRLTFVHGNLRDPDILEQVVPGQDIVVHLAADTRVMDSIEDPQHNFDVNAVGSFRLLQACRKHAVRRVVAASTGGAILGEAPAPVHEEMVPRPLSPYGASKLAMEGYLSAFAGAYGLQTASLRFSNVYGPRSYHKGSVVAHFFKRLLAGDELVVYGDGSQVRDYLYIGDLVDGIRRAVESDAIGIFQFGSGRPTSLNELIDEIAAAIGSERLPVRYDDWRAGEIRTTWCDISKAREAFGFAPETPLRTGLAATWDWFNSRG